MSGNPVDVLRPIIEDVAKRAGLDVDHDALDAAARYCDEPISNMGGKREPDGQSALPRMNRYSIPSKPDPKAVDCPYCVKRPRNLEAHIRAVHPDRLARDWR